MITSDYCNKMWEYIRYRIIDIFGGSPRTEIPRTVVAVRTVMQSFWGLRASDFNAAR